MKNLSSPTLFVLTFLFLGLSSCVTKKSHLKIINTLGNRHQLELEDKTRQWNAQLTEVQDSNINLRLKISEKTGENNALTAMQDKLEGRIEALKMNMEKQGQQSQSSTQNLSKELRSKEEEIARLEGLLAQVDAELEKHLTTLGSLANDMRVFMAALPEDQYSIETSNVKARIIVSEDLLFKPRTTTSVATTAEQILGGLAATLQKYPGLNIMITGHTDNQAPRNKGYKNNWTVSSIRAALLADLLYDEYGLGPNQILAAGKGEFAPMASNETSEGRAQNRRIEFVVAARPEDTVRILQKITSER